MAELVRNAKKRGIYVKPPSILNLHRADGNYCIKDENIYFGLNSIKDVSEKVLDKVRETVSNKDIDLEKMSWVDFLFKLLIDINKRTAESLIKSGCLDYYGVSRKRMMLEYTTLRLFTGKNEIPWMKENYVTDLETTIEKSILSEDKVYSNKNMRKNAQDRLEILQNPGYNTDDDPKYSMRHEKELLGLPLSVTGLEKAKAYTKNTTCMDAANNP